MSNIALLIIGSEIVRGDIRDTNGSFLQEKIKELKHDIKGIFYVVDDKRIVKKTMAFIVSKLNPDFLVISGGLGPTPDDVTLEAYAETFDKKLVISRKVEERIKKKIKVVYSEDDRKMARIPEGSRILKNEQGFAPGIVDFIKGKNKQVKVILLPGPPRELQWIFENEIKNKVIKRELTHNIELEEVKLKLVIGETDESALTQIMERLKREYEVEISSYVQLNDAIKITFKGNKTNVKNAKTIFSKKFEEYIIK